MMKVAFFTLGCKVNQYDADAMRALFIKAGYEAVDFNERADVYVVVTCTVTQTADKKSRQMLARAGRLNPGAVVIAAGCYAQRDAQALKKLDYIDLIIGNADRAHIVSLAEQARNKKINAVADIAEEKDYELLLADDFAGKDRAYLKIQEGCNNFCSYCVIPSVRGPARSMPLASVKAAAESIAENGYQEIVLTGINLTAYGRDLDNAGLLEAVKTVARIERIKRVRLGSMDAPQLSDGFVTELSRIEKFCPHFHISLQSGSDLVLKRMNRRYTTGAYLGAVESIRKHFDNPSVTTDIIVGFPGETEEAFEETCRFAEKVGFHKIHVFPYSKRSGTAAALLPDQIPEKVKRERAGTLSRLTARIASERLILQIGKTEEVLIEQIAGKNAAGYSKNYIETELSAQGVKTGDIVSVVFTGVDGARLKAVKTIDINLI